MSKKTNKPVKPSFEVIEEILDRLQLGQTMRNICKDKHMPSRSSVHRWQREDAAFDKEIIRARREGVWCLYDEILDGFDVATLETLPIVRDRAAHVRWCLKVLVPGQFGDKQTVAHEGNVPIVVGWMESGEVIDVQVDPVNAITGQSNSRSYVDAPRGMVEPVEEKTADG